MLRSQEHDERLVTFIERMDDMSQLLGSKVAIKRSIVQPYLRSLHQVLKNKLRDTRKNGIRSQLNKVIEMICPRSQDQRSIIPKLKIRLSMGKEVSVDLHVRQKESRREKENHYDHMLSMLIGLIYKFN